jgi:hypothetical protein
MKVITFHIYIMVTMIYGIKVVLVLYSVCHYFLFFVTALSFTTLLL